MRVLVLRWFQGHNSANDIQVQEVSCVCFFKLFWGYFLFVILRNAILTRTRFSHMSEFWMVKYFPSDWNESTFLLRQRHTFTIVSDGTIYYLFTQFIFSMLSSFSVFHYSSFFSSILENTALGKWSPQNKLYERANKKHEQKWVIPYLYESIGLLSVSSPAPDQAPAPQPSEAQTKKLRKRQKPVTIMYLQICLTEDENQAKSETLRNFT